MCYNQTGDISTLEGTPLKLVDKFTYLGSSVESTEKDIIYSVDKLIITFKKNKFIKYLFGVIDFDYYRFILKCI